MTAYARAHTNIALIKYWGKADAQRMLPATSSISLTLDDFYTDTAVTFDPTFTADEFYLNGSPVPNTAVSAFLDHVRQLAGLQQFAQVRSYNHVPTAAGLASSASAYAALSIAASEAAGLHLNARERSILARHGSGSATRSIFGGAVIWHRGHDDQSSFAEPLPGPTSDLRMVVAQIDTHQKALSSRIGMAQTAATSPYYPSWVASNQSLITPMRQALAAHDLIQIGRLTELSSQRMHAVMMASEPSIRYYQPKTLAALTLVSQLQAQQLPAYATIDAGPNVKVLTTKKAAQVIATTLHDQLQVPVTIASPGPDARLLTKEEFDDAKSTFPS